MAYGVIIGSSLAYGMYLVVKNNKDIVDEETNKKVTWGIFGVILLECIGLWLIKDPATRWMLLIATTLTFILLMLVRMMIHHHRIEVNSDKCLSGEIKPDYVNESLGVFVTMVNLIMDIARLIFLLKKGKKFGRK